jgi:23S rRNA (uracil1939-C5)-methyltransferase
LALSKGSIVEKAEVIDAGAKGKNIARAGSFVILVDNAVPGDVVDIHVYRKKKGFAEGSAIKWHVWSPDRVIPVCPHFTNCGGCSWQNMTYEKQLALKSKMVYDAFARIGGYPEIKLNAILPSPKTEYYRNRLDFAFSDKKWLKKEDLLRGIGLDDPGVGFHISGRFDKVLDVSRCYLQPEPSNSIRLAAREYAIKNCFSFFDIRNQTGSLRSLIVRTTVSGEAMVIVIFHTETKERIEQFLGFLRHRFPKVTSWYYVVNPKANDTVYDLPHILFDGKSEITEEVDGTKFRIGPKSFFQTNPYQAKNLFKKTLQLAALTGDEVVYDLYTGVGSIALLAAKKAKKVVGIETVAEAIEYAKINAVDNRLSNVEFFAGDVRDILTDEFIEIHGKPDVLIADPPRVGMDATVIEKILEIESQKIVYVSCNPATQARDFGLLKTKYDLVAGQPVDMFPHTYHVENIILLHRKE